MQDPAGINALLESLRSSQVFSIPGTSTSTPSTTPAAAEVSPTTVTSITTPTAQVTPPADQPVQQTATLQGSTDSPSSSSLSTHLSSLLSRLQPLIHRPTVESLPPPSHQTSLPRNASSGTSLRELSFKKSLFILAQLLEDPLVITTIIQVILLPI